MEFLASPETWLSLLTLTVLEIVLGLDNVIFISILAGRLPENERDAARKWGLSGALISRLALLSVIAWIVKLTTPLFTLFGTDFSGKSLVLIAGGIFLLWKATREIHEKLEGAIHDQEDRPRGAARFAAVIAQIVVLDIVFSLDSVITAVGMCQFLSIMIAANVLALGVMLWASRGIASFVEAHPTVKMLALSFLLLIGFTLVVEGISIHIPKSSIYFAMGFSVFVEFLNLKAAARRARASRPVTLRDSPRLPVED